MALWGNIDWIISHGNDSVAIERPTTVTDDLGGRTKTFAAVSEDVAAWVQPASTGTITQYAERDIEITHAVFFSEDPGVLLGDRIVQESRYLLVAGIKNAAEVGLLWRIDCRETQ